MYQPATSPSQAIRPVRKSRIILPLGLLLFAGFCLTTAISYLISRSAIRETILREELPLSSDNIYSEIQRDLFEPILISSLMANDTFVKDWLLRGETNELEIRRFLARIQDQYNTITSFLVSEKSRTYYHSQGVLKTVSEENPADTWYFRVREMADPYEINVDPDMANRDTMTIFINYRIVNGENGYLGATGVGLTVHAVKALMQTYRERYHRDIYFYDQNGALVLHSGENPEAPAERRQLALGVIERLLGDSADNGSFSTTTADGSLANYRYIPELEWILLVEQKHDGTRAILWRTFAVNFVICLITAIILLSLIRMTVLRYQRRLESQNQALYSTNQQIAEQAAALQKANDQLDALHREKDEFIGITVHDLKNPLISVLGFSEILDSHPGLDAEAREYTAYIHRSASDMLRQVNELLEFTEMQSTQTIALAPVDVCKVIRSSADEYALHARNKHTPIQIVGGDTPVLALAHEKWLASAVGNLLSNAIKYSPEGEPITLRVSGDAATVSIAVSDHGAGIPEAEIPRLFQKFERLSTRPTAGESSSGLGLFIVAQMLTRMGGGVTCESAEGKGSTFTMTLLRAPTAGAT